MKLTEKTLRKICNRYGIGGPNQETLVFEYMSQYAWASVNSRPGLPNAGGDTLEFYWRNDDKKSGCEARQLLSFSHAFYMLPCDGGDYIPGTATLYGLDRIHTFYGCYKSTLHPAIIFPRPKEMLRGKDRT
ncbi:MAG: hypothetical protein II942_03290 [Alphaproteobacteria bacterium]|nr:hypothetical protein [Alphaproteobacteria bacterium]